METWERFKKYQERLKTLAETTPQGSWFLAVKKGEASPETWNIVLVGTNLPMLMDVADYLSWKYRDNMDLRYLIAEGQTGKVVKNPFRSGQWQDITP